ncbi:MAG: hypothetical protein LBF78_12760, partial [Treponema sp.]|nr:hypothetical protein [Treponema sp.]
MKAWKKGAILKEYKQEAATMLEKEQKYYTGHRDELRGKYLGKRIVIKDDQILGVYDDDMKAIDAMTAAG